MSPSPNSLKNEFDGNYNSCQIRGFCCIYLITEIVKIIKSKVNSARQDNKTDLETRNPKSKQFQPYKYRGKPALNVQSKIKSPVNNI